VKDFLESSDQLQRISCSTSINSVRACQRTGPVSRVGMRIGERETTNDSHHGVYRQELFHSVDSPFEFLQILAHKKADRGQNNAVKQRGDKSGRASASSACYDPFHNKLYLTDKWQSPQSPESIEN
jgi:hypothetical protein